MVAGILNCVFSTAWRTFFGGDPGAVDGDIRQDHGKFIAPVTADNVGLAQLGLEYLAYLFEKRVAFQMPQSVVVRLEPVDIQKDQAQIPGHALAALDLKIEAPGELAVIVNERQGVRDRQMIQLFIELHVFQVGRSPPRARWHQDAQIDLVKTLGLDVVAHVDNADRFVLQSQRNAHERTRVK